MSHTSLNDAIWASMPVPSLVYDSAERIIDANPSAEGFFNTSHRALVGSFLWHRLFIDENLRRNFLNAQENSARLFINEVQVNTNQGDARVCNLKLAPISGENDLMLLMIAPRELAGRITLTQTAQSASKSAIGMAEMLAHEIKNPLAGITGAAQLLSMGLPPKDLELTDLIVEESRRIVKLLDQVEQFGNLRPPSLSEVNIHDVLDRARRSSQLGHGAHMRFTEDYDPSLPPVYADDDQLLQVLLNLLKNASEAASPKGGVITLRTFYEHSFKMRRADGAGHPLPMQIEISDDGPGIPDDIKANIFEPFVSGKENGTGLGLALASKIISEHNGWLSLDSQPGRTVFRISLPRAPNHAQLDKE